MGKVFKDSDWERERAVLGAALLWGSRVLDDIELLPTHFDDPRNAQIWEAVLAVGNSDPPRTLDLVEVDAWLRDRGVIKLAGGLEYVSRLVDLVPSAMQVPQHVQRLKELARARAVRQGIALIGDIEDSDEMLAAAATRIPDLIDGHEDGVKSIAEVVGDTWQAIASAAKGQRVVTPTGLSGLDRLLEGGMEPQNLVVIGGRPSMGKTSLLLAWVAFAVTQGIAVYLASLEMSARECLMRLASRLALINFSKIRRGELTEMEGERLGEWLERLSKAPLQIDDRAFTLSQIRSRFRRFCRRHRDRLCWAGIDYLQLVTNDMDATPGGRRAKNTNREQEVAGISRALKLLAKETNSPVVLLSQLNRGLESRADKRPQLADLRESGAIEQDADIVIFTYRDEVYSPSDKNRNLAEIIVRKQRNGAIGHVECIFVKEKCSFFDKHKEREAA